MSRSRPPCLTALAWAVALSACGGDPAAGSSGALPGATPLEPEPYEGVPADGGVDTTPPKPVVDLAGQPLDHTRITLTWTAPAAGSTSRKVAMYELRYGTAPITDEASFQAATAAVPPLPMPPGGKQTLTIEGLAPDTAYQVAVRARDDLGGLGPLAGAEVRTRPRARFLVSEIAMLEPEVDGFGTDFVELVAITGGAAGGIRVERSTNATLLHELATFDVVAGDHVVVHLTGLPGPTGFVQEDAAKNATASTVATASAAFDVYSSVGKTGLAGTSQLVRVVDGAAVQDAVAYSDRTPTISSTAVAAWADAYAAGEWSFSAAPVDGCAAAAEVVNVSTITSSNACGRAQSGIAAGKSLQRFGTTDTNTQADFRVAPLTRGAAN